MFSSSHTIGYHGYDCLFGFFVSSGEREQARGQHERIFGSTKREREKRKKGEGIAFLYCFFFFVTKLFAGGGMRVVVVVEVVVTRRRRRAAGSNTRTHI